MAILANSGINNYSNFMMYILNEEGEPLLDEDGEKIPLFIE